MAWTDPIPFFKAHELRCSCCGQIRLDIRFAVAFPALRMEWGEALYPNSVCRCPRNNERVDGHPRSLHLTDNPVHPTDGTMAADVWWRNWSAERKLRFARLSYRMDWSIGLHDGFCHVDWRVAAGLAQRVFLYGEWNGPFGPEEVTG